MPSPFLHDPLTPKEVQELLCFHDVGVKIDGDAGPETTAGIGYFQHLNGLVNPDGALNPSTALLLRKPLDELASMTTWMSFKSGGLDLGVVLPTLGLEYQKRRFREVGGDNLGPCVRMVSDGADGPGTQWCANWASFVLQQAWDILDPALKAAGKKGMPYTRDRYRLGWCPGLKDRAVQDGRLITAEQAKAEPTLVKAGMFFLVRGVDKTTGKPRSVHVGIVAIGANVKGKFGTVEGNATDDDPTRAYEVARRIRGVDGCDFVDLLKGI